MSAHQLGQLLVALAVVVAAARLLGAAAARIGQPPVIGEIVAGILLGPTLFGTAVSDAVFPSGILLPLAGLANVGLVLFMFIVGYEIDPATLRGRMRAAVAVSAGATLLPLVLGTGLAWWLAGRHDPPARLPFVLFIGAAMAVTAMPVLARILTDRGMVRTTVGGMALAAGAFGDIVAWSLLAVVVALGTATGGVPWTLGLTVPYLLVMVLLVRPALGRLAAARERAGRLTPDLLAVLLIGLLLSCWCTELLGVHAIFGAFLYGALMPPDPALRHELLGRLEQVSLLVLLPCFFVLAGLKVDLSGLGGGGLLELAAIIGVAVAGKLLGAYPAARLGGMRPRPAGALAVLMNTRGLTEIVILSVGLQLGILDRDLFSMMVVMALVTTAMAGPLLARVYPARLVESDRLAAERAAVAPRGRYRVLVDVPTGRHASAAVDTALDLVREHPDAVVVLTRRVPYPQPLELDGGLSGELLAMTATLQDLHRLAAPVRAAGAAAHVTAHFSTDPIGDLTHQIAATSPQVVVSATAPAADWPAGVTHVPAGPS